MSVIISNATLVNMPAGWWPTATGGSLTLYNGFSRAYNILYKEQPNVRTCVDFLARNVAQLGLHLYENDAEKGRIRLREHPLAMLLGRPLPGQMKFTRYRMIEFLMSDLGIYGNAFLKKEIDPDGKLVGLLRLPPMMVVVKGALFPTTYEVRLKTGSPLVYEPDEVVHFRCYNSESNVSGLSPLETLRRILAEEHAAGLYREKFWQNSARMNGVISRPSTAGTWSNEARQRFKKEWQALYSGSENSGKTAILEEGMEFKEISFNPKESQYLEGRQLTREECARAYHIPPPLVGILDHATYSNIESQHKSLYTDVLGPWLAMIEEDLKLQLVSDFEDSEDIYLQFNIQEKMQGDFETQMRSLQSATGTAYMTVNEARAIMNLPKIEGADELIVPLNVLMGGQASPTDSAPKEQELIAYFSMLKQILDSGMSADEIQKLTNGITKSKDEIASQARNDNKKELESFETHNPELQEKFDAKWRKLLVRTFERQRDSILPKLKTVQIEAVWDAQRWDEEVTKDFRPLSMATAMAWAKLLGSRLGVIVSEEEMERYIENSARIAAEYLNQSTRDLLEPALLAEDPKTSVQELFEQLLAVTVIRFATGRVTSLGQYGSYKAAIKGRITTKTWVGNSNNPRDEHAAMDGETVGIRDRFSNGLRWPGDYEGSAEQTVHCKCSLRYNRETDAG